jgi:hypothetical protein
LFVLVASDIATVGAKIHFQMKVVNGFIKHAPNLAFIKPLVNQMTFSGIGFLPNFSSNSAKKYSVPSTLATLSFSSTFYYTHVFKNELNDFFFFRFSDSLLNNAVQRTNILYGALNVNVGNIIFVHGSVDPWHALGLWSNTPENAFETIFIRGMFCLSKKRTNISNLCHDP